MFVQTVTRINCSNCQVFGILRDSQNAVKHVPSKRMGMDRPTYNGLNLNEKVWGPTPFRTGSLSKSGGLERRGPLEV